MNYYLSADSFYSQDELAHYGILGMKWGVRRYQNQDGSLTDIGKKRLRIDNDTNTYNSDISIRLADKYYNSNSSRLRKKYKSVHKAQKEFNERKFREYQQFVDSKRAENRRKLPFKERNADLKSAYEAWTANDYTESHQANYEKFAKELGRVAKLDSYNGFRSARFVHDQQYRTLADISTSANKGQSYILNNLDRSKFVIKETGLTDLKKFDKIRSEAKQSPEYKAYSNAEEIADNKIVKKLLNDMGFSDTEQTRKWMSVLAFET